MQIRDRLDIPHDQLAEICRHYYVRELALFGSVLRDDSDIDVPVEFEPGVRISFFTLSALTHDLSVMIRRKVDVVLKRGLNPSIRVDVLERTKIVFAAAAIGCD
ncbi:MAG: nucleotidyltransferase domain-containing protein [Thermomicrobiales bacterium]|nr:nucleotidyltransferase domain-containing protein [Thermomicrobiales bacterium]